MGKDFYDRVLPAAFPQAHLRFRNDDLLPRLRLLPSAVCDRHFPAAFGQFQSLPIQPPPSGLALRYHGHQFGQYNPYLGDGRGFLYGQVALPQGTWLT